MSAEVRYEAILAMSRAVKALPREAWMHTRLTDGRWEILERGEAPPGWRNLSPTNPFFAIDMHHQIEVGDRVVVSEEIYEVGDDRQLQRVVRP